MNINIYYGGRGIIDDPTLVVLAKLQKILEELRVNVKKYNLYEEKNTIPTLPQTLKQADGIILASTVEWYGIGGYMQQFLDACWQFGDKDVISGIYMMPVVMSRTFGEREAKMDLSVAWEILGGKPCSGMCGYIENTLTLEMNSVYDEIIAKKAENLYRCINQKMPSFPSSNIVIKQKVALPYNQTLSPQESEQLSEYVSDDNYVQKQKEDILELASMFKDKLGAEEFSSKDDYLSILRKSFCARPGVAGSYSIHIEGKKQPLIIRIAGPSFACEYGTITNPDVELDMSRATFEDIINGHMTFQRAFMSGATRRMKGDFQILCGLDQVLHF